MRSLQVGFWSRIAVIATAVLLLATGTLLAHDFWLVLEAFPVADGADLSVRGQAGSSFPKNGSAATADRMAGAPRATPVWQAPDGPASPSTNGVSSDSSVVETVDRFHRALAAGDSAAVLALLAPDAVILESGGMETPAEYRSHHLPGDIAFAQAIRRERSPIRVKIEGNVAWATSTSTTVGEYRGRAINSQGAELMVLRRDPTGWRVVAIHWSSRARRQ